MYKVTPTIALNGANQQVPHFLVHESFSGGGNSVFPPKPMKENLIKNRVKKKNETTLQCHHSVCVLICIIAFMPMTTTRLINSIFQSSSKSQQFLTLTSKRCILYIYSTNTGTEYFKHALYSPFSSLQNAVCFIMLTCLVPVLFTFYIQSVLKLKK